MASISTVLVQTALFQRKSRSGWLEELDEIRESALRDGELDDGVSVSDIWTDLRDGGSYEDPHEISGLYADDETPEAPPAPEPPRRKERTKAKGKAKAKGTAVEAEAPPIAAPPIAGPEVDLGGGFGAPPAVAAEPVVHEMPRSTGLPLAEPPATPAPELAPAASAEAEGEQLWVQPSPHPIRPSEMWHPVEMSSPSLGDPSLDPALEERVSSAELDQGTSAVPPFEFQEMTAALEAELVAAADVTVVGEASREATLPIAGGDGPLVGAPVGRRNRRDRPTLPTSPTAGPAATPAPVHDLPPVQDLPPIQDVPAAHQAPPVHDAPAARDLPPLGDRGDTSPLPSEPLPPAALPSPESRLPLAPREEPVPAPAAGPALPTALAPAVEAPEAPAPAPTSTVEDGPRLFSRPPTPAALAPTPEATAPALTPEPAAQAALAPTPEPAPRPMVVGPDGMVDVPGTIVRVRSEAEVAVAATGDLVELAIDRGWAWVSPGDGSPTAVRIELPNASVRVAPGATALAVAEVDGSAFVVVADGAVDLERTDAAGPLARGALAMVDESGAVGLDHATDAEIEADPIVSENLALDAEL
ncbi:MAG: hypothetical protein KDA97_06460 [Acidimicrobiales bacterium]|nr:hypothetical protein [Acidimicrobiales bacterium]